MPSLRKRVSSYFRQLSFYNEPREKKQNINENTFITKYLQGHILIKEGPAILYGKNPTDLPNYDLDVYGTGSSTIIGCYSGPNGGLTTVKRTEKHLSVPDVDIDFIDTQEDVDEVSGGSTVSKAAANDSALPEEWTRRSDHVFGMSDSLYDKNQVTKCNNGDPIADCFGIIARNDSAILAVADGVNWGEKASIAAKSAVHGCLHYLNKTIFNDTKPFENLTKSDGPEPQKTNTSFTEHRINNTREVFVCLLRAFNCAHDLILENEGMLTTLTVAVVLPLKQKVVRHPTKERSDSSLSKFDRDKRTGQHRTHQVEKRNSHDRKIDERRIRKTSHDMSQQEGQELYVCCVCNVGDTLAYVYSQKYGVRELTKGSHDINCNRDMRDALGALGPVDGIKPELSNLTISITTLQKGDIVMIASDGLTDNFDPNVCRFTVNSKINEPLKVKRPSASRDHAPTQRPEAHKENVQERSGQETLDCSVQETQNTSSPKAQDKLSRIMQDKSGQNVQEPEAVRLSEPEKISEPDKADETVSKVEDTTENKSKIPQKPPRKNKSLRNSQEREKAAEVCAGKNTVPGTVSDGVIAEGNIPGQRSSTYQETSFDCETLSSTKNVELPPIKPMENLNKIIVNTNLQHESCSDRVVAEVPEFDNPLIAQFVRNNSVDDSSSLEKVKSTLANKTSTSEQNTEKSKGHQSKQTSLKRHTSSSHDSARSSSQKHSQSQLITHKTTTRNIPLSSTLDVQNPSKSISKRHETKANTSKKTESDRPAHQNKYNFLRSKTSLDMHSSAKPLLRNEDGIPFVTPLQRYELTLLLMEDILKRGISGHDPPCVSAKKLCENLVSFTFSITSAKRHTLEDSEYYFDNVDGVLVEVSQHEKKIRRRRGLEKVQNLPGKLDHQTSPEAINYVYEIDRCANWIQNNDYKKVCLQFPDYLLPDSTEVALRLQSLLKQTIYVLGDTAYESCCVDYVAAAHVEADGIIHYGPVCFSQSSNDIPCLKIYEKGYLDVQNFLAALSGIVSNFNDSFIILLDTPYICYEEQLKSECQNRSNIKVCSIDAKDLHIVASFVIFLGDNNRKLINLKFIFNCENLFYYSPKQNAPSIINYEADTRILKRRNYLTEKIKDSNTVGIIIGTVAVKNYLKVIERIKKLVQTHGKKYYVISVGKPTVAKLANFPEIDVYVVISCAMNEIYDNRDFYKPIVTPFDVEQALNPNSKSFKFSYDYNAYIPNMEFQNDELEAIKIASKEEDVSLLTGHLRRPVEDEVTDETRAANNEIAVRGDSTIVASNHHGAGFLSTRSWKGLEQNLGETEVEMAKEGRKGIAQNYENETT